MKLKKINDSGVFDQLQKRIGPGEQGKPHFVTDVSENALNKKLFDENGYYGLVR